MTSPREKALSTLTNARTEADGAITADCPLCATDGHPGKRLKLFCTADGKITGVSCARFASAGTEANRTHCAPIREQLSLGAPSAAFLCATLFEGERQITLEIERATKAVQFVTARNCTAVLHSAELRLARPDDRATFVAAIPERDGAERDAIGRELVQLFDKFRRAQVAIESEDSSSDSGKDSAATLLIKLAEEAQLIHNSDGDGYALMMVDGHKEVWPLRSKGFKQWLAHQFYLQFGKSPGSQAVQDALGVIEGKARYDGPERKIFIRIGERDGKIYLDLADAQWRAVEIDESGWRVVSIPPVEFRRAKGMLPLPVPVSGGDIEELRSFLNLEADSDLWKLMRGSLVMKFRPRGPYNVDVFTGEQGCGKTTRARVIRALVDPSIAEVRSEPREVRDLHIAASNEWLPIFDNLSRIPAWLSDAFCCLSTGGGMRTRELYSDGEEAIFSTMRPLILTSITEVVERPDLLDRALIYNLPTIEKSKRKAEKRFWREFEAARPGILGALLDAVACALRNELAVELEDLPRMADFVCWVTAAEPALGMAAGEFLAAYRRNLASGNEIVLESWSIAADVLRFVEAQQSWTGTAKQLHETLSEGLTEEERRKRKEAGWPKNPKVLSDTLRRLSPNLLASGISVEFLRRTMKEGRRLQLTWTGAPEQNEKNDEQDRVCFSASSASSASSYSKDSRLQDDAEGNPASLLKTSASSAESSASSESNDDAERNPASSENSLCVISASYTQTADKTATCSTDDADDADDAEKHTQSYDVQIVALDTETEPFDEKRGITPRNAKMIGLALSYDGEGKTSYTTDPEAWPLLMPEQEQTVVMHNAKFDLGVLRCTGLPEPERWEDTLIAAHLLNETGEHGLKPLAKEHLGVADPLSFEEADRMRLLNPEVFTEYAKNDARYTFRLWRQFEPELKRQELQLAYRLEKSVLPVVIEMETRGMLIDVAALRKAGAETDAHLKRLEADIYAHAGCKFDLRSPQKLGVILTDKLSLRLPIGGRKGAPSTDKHALKELAGQHPIIPPLLEFRELDKLASAFIAKLPELADSDGRIHPTFNQLGATSGRFTCSNPNVQQMPRSSGLAALLRAAFIAGPGRKLVCADWSQIELRVLAHYSQDQALIDAFLSGADLQARTAALMFGKAEAEISKRERTIAKSINFGIAYGMGAPGLFKSLNAAGISVNQDECAEFINTYHASYPGVRRFLDRVGRQAERQGFVRTLSGRKRRLSSDGSNMLSVKNAVIQGSAADIAKHALVCLHKALPAGAHLIAMIHDEFIVDCREDRAAEVLAITRTVMERQPKNCKVPLRVDAQIGDNWGACK